MILRVYWKLLGGHVHCRVFSGTRGRTFALCGKLVFTEGEWKFHAEEYFGKTTQFVKED